MQEVELPACKDSHDHVNSSPTLVMSDVSRFQGCDNCCGSNYSSITNALPPDWNLSVMSVRQLVSRHPLATDVK